MRLSLHLVFLTAPDHSCGLWSVVCGLWSVVCGLWSVDPIKNKKSLPGILPLSLDHGESACTVRRFLLFWPPRKQKQKALRFLNRLPSADADAFQLKLTAFSVHRLLPFRGSLQIQCAGVQSGRNRFTVQMRADGIGDIVLAVPAPAFFLLSIRGARTIHKFTGEHRVIISPLYTRHLFVKKTTTKNRCKCRAPQPLHASFTLFNTIAIPPFSCSICPAQVVQKCYCKVITECDWKRI